MKRFKEILRLLIYWVTRKNARHNRALRDLLYQTKTIEDFFAKYRLQEDTKFKAIFEHIGQARIDATDTAYQTGIRISRARTIEGKEELSPLVKELYDDLEELKRSLFTRTLSTNILAKEVSRVDIALENLLAALSDIKLK
jgi:hypothetical protein